MCNDWRTSRGGEEKNSSQTLDFDYKSRLGISLISRNNQDVSHVILVLTLGDELNVDFLGHFRSELN